MPNDYNQDVAMDVYPVRLTAKHARRARKLGEGNLSLGIRLAIEALFRLEAKKKDPGAEPGLKAP